jgi:uncharacterized protein YprB with RNaseH-like and TPR domain
MTSLSDKLKSLGVQMGAKNIPAPSFSKAMSLEEATGGFILETINGETFIVDTPIAANSTAPHPALNIPPSFTGLAKWINNSKLNDLSLEQFSFVDIETTGLSGGSGTFAFLIGAGRFENDVFLTRQFFLRDPSEENAQLTAFEEFIAPCHVLVTFNGKSFDAPIINSRFTIQGWRSPLPDLIHIDLLHLARRLWPNRLPSRTLGNLEIQILNTSRTEQDIPGWMIPQIYMDYLHYGDTSPMKQVFYHNLQDVITLAKLLNYTSHLLSEPLSGIIEYGVDLIAIARLFEDIGDTTLAADLYFQGLDYELPKNIMLDAIHRLSLIHKRNQEYTEAVILWERAAQHQYLEAYIELAKYFEHHVQEYSSALYWTESAIEIVRSEPGIYKKETIESLQHRLERLNRLQGKQTTTTTNAPV